jgi:hypothetical protein
MRSIIRGVGAAVLVVGLVGGIGGAAQAQSMPRHDGREIEAVQPRARDMTVHQGVPARAGVQSPATVYGVHCDDGTRIRATPYGTTIGLCYWSQYVTADDGNTRVTADGYVWDWTTDWATGVSGWVRADCIWTP